MLGSLIHMLESLIGSKNMCWGCLLAPNTHVGGRSLAPQARVGVAYWSPGTRVGVAHWLQSTVEALVAEW